MAVAALKERLPADRVITAGPEYAAGMAGLTLGGGYGPLGRRFGLAADNLTGAEVVLADGSAVWADAEREPDLLLGAARGRWPSSEPVPRAAPQVTFARR